MGSPIFGAFAVVRRQTLHRPKFESRDSLHSMLNSVQATVVAVPVLSVYSLMLFVLVVLRFTLSFGKLYSVDQDLTDN